MISYRENLLKFYNRKCPDYIPDMRRDFSPLNVSFCQYEAHPPVGESGYDGFGVYWQYEEKSKAHMPMPDPKTGKYVMTIDDMENWRDFIKIPDPDSYDWEAHVARDMTGVRGGQARPIATMRGVESNPGEDADTKLVNVSIGHGMFERLHSLMGMEDGAMALVAEPDAVREFFDALADYKCKTIEKIVYYYPKVDLIDMSDDWGHQNAAFFSVDTWNELFRPGMTRIINCCKRLGVIFQLHSCGRWEKIIPAAVDAGLEHWTSSQAVNDIESILKTYGHRLTMIGGCDVKEIQLPGMTVEKIKECVGQRIDKLCRGGCLIPFGNSSTPFFRQAVEECVAERADFYQKPENRRVPDPD